MKAIMRTMRPDGPPLGLLLASTSKAVGRAFNSALAANGGSIPIWLILNALRSEQRRSQVDLARAVGIEGPTLTRHLDGMEQAGLVERKRGAVDRRSVQVELTRAGQTLHGRLLKAVIAFNEQLLAGFSRDEVEAVRGLLGRLQANIGDAPPDATGPPS
ncbi:MAG TPA: MarR family transcriptional regulator [Gaiellaceae bacterium]|nr:MarR family transcriptional regulator [Gaiellaceae bacterium]